MYKNIDRQAVAAMIMLCLVWSMQQIGLKATAHDASPILQIALRSGIGAVLVALFMLYRREKPSLASLPWRAGLGAGLLFALEYLLLGTGLRFTSAAHGVVFLYTAPLFAAVGLHFSLRSERLKPVQWLGIVLAFAGVAITFFTPSSGQQSSDASSLFGDALCLLSGAAWGATTVLVRCSGLAKVSASQTAIFQLSVAFIVLLGFAVLTGQTTFHATPLLIANLLFQSVIVSFLSLLLWFSLLRRYLASGLGAFSFLTPLFGVALGAWLLNEKINPGFMVGALFVVAGIVCVSCHAWLASRFVRQW
ncbi:MULTISPECIES: DMT family transporter [unclassified Janthinobacterium]|uniref:DMT family transporter n=1 Tax=unclassified Janthinobacterium TaxID=2610881 RepID=UPI001619F38D|nr:MULTISPECIES: DMT family transporter [unclassified Janthinobacterium]MBB5369307.1 drug/metabolite transporter (DMT)-like permease [Janthinobacterium sp. K2C7]MBB5381157.1 drug/metabolite transporter (DMT)-like permease [Janthinobacterium sp. K2Li3]MBB5387690.1 drug/metabolite transporter (DMT)-like permease [Janthinobacterium sp. K2E3]